MMQNLASQPKTNCRAITALVITTAFLFAVSFLNINNILNQVYNFFRQFLCLQPLLWACLWLQHFH